MADLLADVSYALRRLGRAPLPTSAVIVTLALGLGANTAVFGAVNGVLLKSRAETADPGVVAITMAEHGRLYPERTMRREYLEQLLIRPPTRLERMSGVRQFRTLAHFPGGDRAVLGEAVFGEYFALVGARPVLGRLFAVNASEDARVAVIGERLWRSALSASPDVIGQTLVLGGQPYTIVGVVSSSLRGLVLGNLVPYDVWVPRANAPGLSRDDHTLAYLIGHVKPDVTLDAARAEMNVIGASLDPARPEIGLGVEPLADALFSGPPAFFVAAAVLLLVSGLVFLIAIANLTNLFLTGVLNRRHELTVRRMLGAEHGRLARLLAVEATLLVLGGWALGLGLARLAGSALAYLPLPERGGIVPAFDASPDWRVFCFAFVTALVVATTIAVSRHMFAAARPFTRSSRTSVGHPVQWPRQRPRAYPAVVTSPLAVSRSRTRPRSMICEARSSRPRRRSSRRSGCAFSPGVISWRVMQALPPASFSSTNELPARWV